MPTIPTDRDTLDIIPTEDQSEQVTQGLTVVQQPPEENSIAEVAATENKTTSTPVLPTFTDLQYVKLTDVHRVRDLNLPPAFTTPWGTMYLPRSLRKKDVHYTVNSNMQIVKSCWLHKSIGYFLNALYLLPTNTDAALDQLAGSLQSIDEELGGLIKKRVLTKRSGPGFMAFCQAHESVPENCVVLSPRTWRALCAFNKGWAQTRQVQCTRYPNLGPNTTLRLQVLVNEAPPRAENVPESMPSTSLGARLPQLADLLRELDEEALISQQEEETSGLLDSVYLNPKTLKDKLKGDGDGDQVFLKRIVRGLPRFQLLDLTRTPGTIQDEHLQQLKRKSARVVRQNLGAYLPQYFDDTPIDSATYAVRWKHYLEAEQEHSKNSLHPMHSAWHIVGPQGIDLIEFIMDMRKGEFTEEDILSKLAFIDETMQEIRAYQQQGNWYAVTVTNAMLSPYMAEFVKTFQTLSEYMELITHSSVPHADTATTSLSALSSLLDQPNQEQVSHVQ